MSTFPFWPWFAAIIGESFIIAWLYNSADRCLMIAVVFHVASNIFAAIIGIDSHISLALVNAVVAVGLFSRYENRLGLRRRSAELIDHAERHR